MTESLGARLRHQRERQQIDLRTIAQQTKIKASLLEGLERDDVSRWPSGIFRRTYFRDYVQAIGLPVDQMMREFLETHPDPEDILSSLSGALAQGDRGATGESTSGRLRQALESVFGALSGSRSGDMPAPAEDGPSRVPGVERLPSVQRVSAIEPSPEPPARPDLRLVAELCTRLARTDRLTDRNPLLTDLVGALGAQGVIVWVREPDGARLRPALACGYRDEVLAHLPPVGLDEPNATAVACRSAQLCAVNGRKKSNCALAVPLITPAGCGGVLALEFAYGDAPTESHRALATIVAAQVARLLNLSGQDSHERRMPVSSFLEVTG
jgi:hypothetical protein